MEEQNTLYQQNAQEAAHFADDVAEFDRERRQQDLAAWAETAMQPAPVGAAMDPAGGTTVIQPQEQLPEDTSPRDGMSLGEDVTRGLMQAPRSVIRGAGRGIKELLEIPDDLNRFLGLPYLQIINDKGEFDPQLLAQQGEDQKGLLGNVGEVVPIIDKPGTETATGNLIEGVARFMVGFKGVDKAVKGIRALSVAEKAARASGVGRVAAEAVKGAAADLAVFDGQEERLSNLVQDFPELQNPVTEYLAADPEDSAAEAKFKQALEGLALGGLTEGLAEGVKLVRNSRIAKNAVNDGLGKADDLVELPPQEAAGAGLEAEAFKKIGDPTSDELILQKINTAAGETAGLGTEAGIAPKGALDVSVMDNGKGSVEIKKGDAVAGAIKYKSEGSTVQIVRSDVDETLQGQGIGTSAYKQFIDQQLAKGRTVGSDVDISAPVQRIFEKLQQEGYTVKKAEGARQMQGGRLVNLTQEEMQKQRKAWPLETVDGVRMVRPENRNFTGKPVFEVTKGPTKGVREYELNFARIEGPDDVKQVMDRLVNEPSLTGGVEKARRGLWSNEQTLTAATDINGFDSLLTRRVGEAFNAEQIVAARTVYYKTTDKLMELAKAAASPEATVADQFAFRRMIAVHQAVQKEFMGVRAEAGRALQAWKIPVGKTAAESLREVENVLTEFGGPEASTALARRLAAVGNNISTDQINTIVQKSAVARTADAVNEAWTLGLLTNPTTHVVNIQSNMLTSLQLGVERLVAAGVSDSPIELREGVSYFQALMQSQREAFKNAATAFRTGEVGIGMGKIDLPRIRSTSREVLDAQGIFKPFGYAMDWYGGFLNKYVGGSLAAGDEYSKTILYRAQLKALATREAIAKGLDGDEFKKFVAEASENPSEGMRADAVQFANYGTFTKELGQTGQSFQRIIGRNPALRYVVPFIRTPVNIFKFTFERTPLAPLSKGFREDLQAGGVRRAQALAKIGTGSTVMFTGMDMSLNGQITGAGPSDPKQRAALRRTGWQPYSIKVGDTYYSYARFEPVATPLGMAADMAEILSNYESYDIAAQQDVDKLVTAGIAAIGNQVVGKTFMSGFADLTEVLSDPDRYAQTFINRYAGSIVPAGVGAIERAIDPQMEYVFNEMDAIKARIPGLSDEVPNRLNVWGEEINTFYPGKGLDGIEERALSLVNPVYYSKQKDAPVDRFMLQNGFTINMPQKTQNFDGVRVDLRKYPAAYHQLVKARGQEVRLIQYGNMTMQEFFKALVDKNTPHAISFFSQFTDADEQQNFINKAVSDYNKAARDIVVQNFPEVAQEIEEQRILEQQQNANRGAEGIVKQRPLP